MKLWDHKNAMKSLIFHCFFSLYRAATVCATYGLPEIGHSDQGRAFESTILRQTLEAFGTKKTHTTLYHPQGDGMVEQFNRSLLQLLRIYVEKEEDWEQYLPLAHCKPIVLLNTHLLGYHLFY